MGAVAKGLSYLIFTRYSFEAMLYTGELFHEVGSGAGGADRRTRAQTAVRWAMGFKENSDDPGFAFVSLIGVLATACVAMLFVALVFTHRSREGN